MKKFRVSIFTTLVLYFCTTIIQAQSQSDQHSNVISTHSQSTFFNVYGCPETGPISWEGELNWIFKRFSDEKWSLHFNIYSEGEDENGGLWHSTEVFNNNGIGNETFHSSRSLVAIGPNGAKLKFKVVLAVKGNGELAHFSMDPLCD